MKRYQYFLETYIMKLEKCRRSLWNSIFYCTYFHVIKLLRYGSLLLSDKKCNQFAEVQSKGELLVRDNIRKGKR
jgi:hypothetical protein